MPILCIQFYSSCIIYRLSYAYTYRSWFWIDSQAAPQFTGIIMNTGVHVIMYYYFYLKSIGISPKWKSYVTLCQIVQFVLSIVVIAITLAYSYQRRENNILYPQCKGINIVLGSLLFNATLLNGFVGVLLKGGGGGKGGNGGKSGVDKKTGKKSID